MNKLLVKTLLWSVIGIIVFAAYSIANLSSLVNRCDVNRDGVINVQDLVLIANHMGERSDYPVGHLYAVGDRVRGFVRRVNDNPTNSFIGLSYIDPSVEHEEFRFYVPPETWEIQGLAEVLYKQLNIDVRITGLRPDGSYEATLILLGLEPELGD